MKKFIIWFCTVSAFLFFVVLLINFLSVNMGLEFLDTTAGYYKVIDWIVQYGAMTILAVLVFANAVGKGAIRIIFLVVFILVALFLLINSFAPSLMGGLFGNGGSGDGLISNLNLLG